MNGARSGQLEALKKKLLFSKELPLFECRQENNYLPVFGEGSENAEIMFVGEAPGRNEAKTGRPFCGSAGKILDKLVSSIGLKREDIYITNIVKDRPPKNRDPLPEEIMAYGPFLDCEIEIIQPKILCGLGRYSSHYLLSKFECPQSSDTIGNLHGRVVDCHASYGPIKIIPLYHPAACIYNQDLKVTLKKDFQILKTLHHTF